MKQLIELCKKFNCKYLENEKMSLHTTFKIGGNARLVVYPQNEEQIGELVMERLKKVDEVSYVRFASVYRQFKDINTFMEELNKLLTEKK